MALLRKKTDKKTTKIDKLSSASIITSCTKVQGDFVGGDTIHIDGNVIGNITVTNTVVIGKSGVVEGNVEAKHVIINGQLKGSVKCEKLEVLTSGKVSKYIEGKELILEGDITGDITGHESIDVLEKSTVHAICIKSKKITVAGKIKGTVLASELLEIKAKGFVEGQISAKSIKTEEGGRMVGTMSTYEEEKKVPKKK
ncbi:MAG: hypothetical protein GQ531_03935 [Sulfurovum sp.]|nr:hypothetical protein [Sulfurovum sp.]